MIEDSVPPSPFCTGNCMRDAVRVEVHLTLNGAAPTEVGAPTLADAAENQMSMPSLFDFEEMDAMQLAEAA